MKLEENIDIFISYSVKDSAIVTGYVHYLENAGYKLWFDKRGLYSGVKFTDEIVKAINSCKLLLFFSSANSNESSWVLGEIFTAKHYNKKILPIRIDKTEYSSKILLIMLPLQYVEYRAHTDEHHEEVLQTIIKHIGKSNKAKNEFYVNKTNIKKRKHDVKKKAYIITSFVISLIFSMLMLWVSGEDYMNRSLSLT